MIEGNRNQSIDSTHVDNKLSRYRSLMKNRKKGIAHNNSHLEQDSINQSGYGNPKLDKYDVKEIMNNHREILKANIIQNNYTESTKILEDESERDNQLDQEKKRILEKEEVFIASQEKQTRKPKPVITKFKPEDLVKQLYFQKFGSKTNLYFRNTNHFTILKYILFT